jgi:hypothetical protein
MLQATARSLSVGCELLEKIEKIGTSSVCVVEAKI